MNKTKQRELIVGIIMLICGLGYMWMSSQVERIENQYGFVDARFVPFALSAIMILLGILQLRAARTAADSEDAAGEITDYRTVFKTLALIIAYIILLEPVGFVLTTVVYLVLQFTVLTPAKLKPNYPQYLLIAVLTSAIIYLLFRYAFDMVLPVGVFGL